MCATQIPLDIQPSAYDEEHRGRWGPGGHVGPMLKDEWLTPPELVESLGTFDLDPCSPVVRPWDTALKHYTVEDDGLSQPWRGRIFLNPPYGRGIGKWMARMADASSGIALTFARTDTKVWRDHIWEHALAIKFLEGRLHFHHVSGARAKHCAGAPSVLISYSPRDTEALDLCKLPGQLVRL